MLMMPTPTLCARLSRPRLGPHCSTLPLSLPFRPRAQRLTLKGEQEVNANIWVSQTQVRSGDRQVALGQGDPSAGAADEKLPWAVWADHPVTWAGTRQRGSPQRAQAAGRATCAGLGLATRPTATPDGRSAARCSGETEAARSCMIPPTRFRQAAPGGAAASEVVLALYPGTDGRPLPRRYRADLRVNGWSLPLSTRGDGPRASKSTLLILVVGVAIAGAVGAFASRLAGDTTLTHVIVLGSVGLGLASVDRGAGPLPRSRRAR